MVRSTEGLWAYHMLCSWNDLRFFSPLSQNLTVIVTERKKRKLSPCFSWDWSDFLWFLPRVKYSTPEMHNPSSLRPHWPQWVTCHFPTASGHREACELLGSGVADCKGTAQTLRWKMAESQWGTAVIEKSPTALWEGVQRKCSGQGGGAGNGMSLCCFHLETLHMDWCQ